MDVAHRERDRDDPKGDEEGGRASAQYHSAHLVQHLRPRPHLRQRRADHAHSEPVRLQERTEEREQREQHEGEGEARGGVLHTSKLSRHLHQRPADPVHPQQCEARMFSSVRERQQILMDFFFSFSCIKCNCLFRDPKMASYKIGGRSSVLLAAAILVTAVWRRRRAMLAARFAELHMMCERGDEEAVVR